MSGTIAAVEGAYLGFNSQTAAVVVNDDLSLTADETNGVVSDGTYDWIELLGATTISICLLPNGTCEPAELSPADGEEWTLALISDTSWIGDGSLIPDDLSASYTALMVGIEFDAAGNETGFVFANVIVTPSAPASVPATGPLGSLVLVGLILVTGTAMGLRRPGESIRA